LAFFDGLVDTQHIVVDVAQEQPRGALCAKKDVDFERLVLSGQLVDLLQRIDDFGAFVGHFHDQAHICAELKNIRQPSPLNTPHGCQSL
jgi:hypothetical protein